MLNLCKMWFLVGALDDMHDRCAVHGRLFNVEIGPATVVRIECLEPEGGKVFGVAQVAKPVLYAICCEVTIRPREIVEQF